MLELSKRFPEIVLSKPKWATLGVAEEFRQMKVGDVLLFPVEEYAYSTIRSAPNSSLVKESMIEGRRWTTVKDSDNKCITVLRIA